MNKGKIILNDLMFEIDFFERPTLDVKIKTDEFTGFKNLVKHTWSGFKFRFSKEYDFSNYHFYGNYKTIYICMDDSNDIFKLSDCKFDFDNLAIKFSKAYLK